MKPLGTTHGHDLIPLVDFTMVEPECFVYCRQERVNRRLRKVVSVLVPDFSSDRRAAKSSDTPEASRRGFGASKPSEDKVSLNLRASRFLPRASTEAAPRMLLLLLPPCSIMEIRFKSARTLVWVKTVDEER